MKILLALIVFVFSGVALCADSVYLSAGATYLDDYNQTLAPEVALTSISNWKSIGAPWLETSSYLGEGFINLQPDASGNVENGFFTEYRLQAQFHFGSEWAVSVQDGVVWSAPSNRQEFNSWDDKLSLQVLYKLK